ncbi:MAG: nickel pincer cofactor biosynthesis protein LarC [Planctomycetota bacterium]
MSRHLHLDLVGGIAGDMTVAALADAGGNFAELERRLLASGLPLTRLTLTRVWRGGMAGAHFTVEPERQAPSRHWSAIRPLVAECRLSERARDLALAIFGRLAEAEAEVHGCTPDEVHFHEVGAMDSIADIVGAAVAIDLLGATSFSCSTVPICPGSVRGDHGVMPLPAPATARLLRGFTLTPIEGTLETVTPTGAAILATLCPHGDGAVPAMRLLTTGTGLGTAELPGRPNVLRVLLGERVDAAAQTPSAGGNASGHAVVIEASIDDMDPRLYGEVSARLFQAGALDVTLSALQMKKGRPGTLLSVLARPELEGLLTGLILRETTTLGVRSHDVRRTELARRHETVVTRFGAVRVKLGLLGEECLNLSPEFEDCARLAHEAGVPVKDVLAAAVAAASERWTGARC